MPGVGAAADTMANLRRSGFVEPIREYIASGRPFLGVCMGQQALFDVSEEGGEHECLGILPGRVVRFCQRAEGAAHGLEPGPASRSLTRYSRASRTARTSTSCTGTIRSRKTRTWSIGETDYGVTFASVIARDNVVATQFHPEKSGEAGLRMYANFLKIAATAGIVT